MKRMLAGLLVALVMLPAIAAAETAQGYYLGARIGWTELHDWNGDDFDNLTYKDGYAVMGAIGYALSSGLRFELEGAYRRNDLDPIFPTPFMGPIPATGEMQSATAMANAYYDFDLGPPVSPFVGAGLGIGFLWENTTWPSTGEVRAESGPVGAFQGTVGVSALISSRVVVDLAYTYFVSMSSLMFAHRGQESNNAMVGLRFFF